MALCTNYPDPGLVINNAIIPFGPPIGEGEDHHGDYSVAGVGTRNFGKGTIRLKDIPDGATIDKAILIFNTYQANTPILITPSVTIQRKGALVTGVTAFIGGICGSTCWYNPGPEATTYLRNRVYYADVGATVIGNGDYLIDGLPKTPAMRISTDGDRLPGCLCSQGAILYVVWSWANAKSPKGADVLARGIQAYLGARLISSNPTFGSDASYNLAFEPVQSSIDEKFFKGNVHIVTAAGDTQRSIPGDSFAINQVQFVPPNNAFTKIGPSLSVRQYSVAQIYDGENSAFAKTTNDCICWFFFAVSGDKTAPKSQFQIVNCCATYLMKKAEPEDTKILVFSNFVQDTQTMSPMACLICGQCRAVEYTVDPDKPPPSNPPGMFPAAPYYIKIDNEIMKVTAKGKTQGPGPPLAGGGAADPTTWTVERGQAGTMNAFHEPSLPVGTPNPFNLTQVTCVYMLAPPRFIRDMQAALAAKGQPNQKPGAGMPAGGG